MGAGFHVGKRSKKSSAAAKDHTRILDVPSKRMERLTNVSVVVDHIDISLRRPVGSICNFDHLSPELPPTPAVRLCTLQTNRRKLILVVRGSPHFPDLSLAASVGHAGFVGI